MSINVKHVARWSIAITHAAPSGHPAIAINARRTRQRYGWCNNKRCCCRFPTFSSPSPYLKGCGQWPMPTSRLFTICSSVLRQKHYKSWRLIHGLWVGRVPTGRGAIGVLHTWKRDLGYHPHVHFLVPGGGLDFVNDRWLPTHNHFFVRVEPLSKLFRAKMRDGLKKAGLYHQIPTTAWQQDWVVHSKPVGHGETAAAYLADYLFCVGISNSRIVTLENDEVTFWVHPSADQTTRLCHATRLHLHRPLLAPCLAQGLCQSALLWLPSTR